MLQNLKRLRQEAGISQECLAAALGITQQSIYQYENRGTEPNIDLQIKIADFFGTSVDFLVGYTDIREKIDYLKEFGLSSDEGRLLSDFRRLSTKQKDSILSHMESYFED